MNSRAKRWISRARTLIDFQYHEGNLTTENMEAAFDEIRRLADECDCIMRGTAIYDTARSAELVNSPVRIFAQDSCRPYAGLTYVEWPDGYRSWTPSFNIR